MHDVGEALTAVIYLSPFGRASLELMTELWQVILEDNYDIIMW